MIKCSLQTLEIKGPMPVILTECTEIISGVKNMMIRERGVDFAEQMMKEVLRVSALDEKEVTAENERYRKANPLVAGFADVLTEALFSGGGQNVSRGSVEED